ncbi:MAG TPA: transglycosylase family protein [Thermoleophilaceae bacterium]|nr:transglycosylase family protein [Thermoleophilaceae bacterium]
MRHRFLVILVVVGVLAPSGAALATDGESGGAEAPPAGSQKTEAGHKTIKLPKILKKIARCESGGDIHAISANGKYRGKYQFSRPTWRSVGGHGDPAKASEYEQDKRALKLYKREGTKPWPNCA